MGKRWMVIPALLLVSGTGLAAEDVVQRAQRCATVTDSLERLVCYDRLFAQGAGSAAAAAGPALTPAPAAAPRAQAAAPASRAAAPTPPAAAPAPTTPASSPASDFGADQLRRSGARDEAEPRTLTAAIEQLRETRPNVFLMTLDNGQVWQQMDMDSLFHVEVGDTVEINRGRLGGYRMARKSRGGSGWVRVNRVR